MTTLVHFNPFNEVQEMSDRINRLFSELQRGGDDVMRRGSWIPPVDIYEDSNHELVLKAELPDMKREDIELTVENNTLTVRGEKKPNGIGPDQFHRVERVFGSFSRSFSLPPTIDSERVSAEYRDGVLTIRLPMREEAKPRQIKINPN
ncbi:MAG: Hsp20/alpha crystallin family protein [Acidobacteria bacterium]|nr:Hsp20/alpha crystallin family protein [Acidobacteriota bacterium]